MLGKFESNNSVMNVIQDREIFVEGGIMNIKKNRSLREQKSANSSSWTDAEWGCAIKDYERYPDALVPVFPYIEWDQHCRDNRHRGVIQPS